MFGFWRVALLVCWGLLPLLAGCGSAPEAKAPSKKKKTAADLAPLPPPIALPKVQQSDFASVDDALSSIKKWSGKNDEQAGRERVKIDLWLNMQGAKIAPDLAAKIKDSSADLEIRVAACRVLAKLGESARPALMETLASDQKLLRLKATEGLGRIKPANVATVKKLIELIDNKDFDTRKAALNALTEIGPAAKESVPKLIAVRNDVKEDETIRALAHSALKKVDPRTGLQKAY